MNGDKELEKKRMNIATALNRKYVKYTYVMLTSLLMNQSDEDICVYLLHSDLTQQDQEQLRDLVESYNQRIQFLLINRDVFPLQLPTTLEWSLEAYYRLLLLDILPLDVDRILYLDVDMIINKPLKELYWTDFGECMFCACRDMSVEFPVADMRNQIFEKQILQGFTYFNSGMMLWNVEKLRLQYCFKDYMDLAESSDFRLIAPDQDLLNLMHYEHIKFLDEYQYDLFSKIAYDCGIRYEDVKKETTIVHYAGWKPWNGGEGVHYDIEQLWWDYAKLTPFYVELMEDFLHSSINNPFIYESFSKCFETNRQLIEELEKSESMCKKLLQFVEAKKFNSYASNVTVQFRLD